MSVSDELKIFFRQTSHAITVLRSMPLCSIVRAIFWVASRSPSERPFSMPRYYALLQPFLFQSLRNSH